MPELRPALRGRAGPGADERGSGSVLGLATCAVLLVLVVAALTLVPAVLAAHRARGAADLAAVAGATAAARGGDPCMVARAVGARADAQLAGCRAVGPDVTVEMSVAGPRGLPPARAQARAGPRTSRRSAPAG
ncbi:hypothetical protein QK900_13770 [Arsenicicoccus dermatophilus]|uniref:Rv3654c family TadE-like protein n=1 Tax=Arsenicicoccus dermatophilus TaxID=1076331 RepID=UPI003891F9E0